MGHDQFAAELQAPLLAREEAQKRRADAKRQSQDFKPDLTRPENALDAHMAALAALLGDPGEEDE